MESFIHLYFLKSVALFSQNKLHENKLARKAGQRCKLVAAALRKGNGSHVLRHSACQHFQKEGQVALGSACVLKS